MPIVSTDIQTRYSGGAGNASANASLGGVESATAFASGVQNNLFDDVSGAESAAGDTNYRGFYAHNAHASLTWQGPVVWLDSLTSSPDTEFDLAVAAEAVNITMATIASEATAPTGVTFSRPTSKATGSLSLGDLAAGARRGIWIKRTVNPGAAAANDSGSFRIEGDTAA